MTTTTEHIRTFYKKTQYKHIQVKGNELIVNTPVPYTVVRQYPHESDQDAMNKAYSLNQNCQFLYDVLKLLGISKAEAVKNNYTLNLATGRKLTAIAASKSISNEIWKVIDRHDW